MTCCGLTIKEPRNADLRRTFSFRRKGYSFAAFTARMQVRTYEGAPDPPLLDIGMTSTPNGSVFTIVGDALVLTINKTDLESLPTATPISDPIEFVYDIILTDQSGFVNKFTHGPFIMIEGVTR